jgi:hypothetical protein
VVGGRVLARAAQGRRACRVQWKHKKENKKSKKKDKQKDLYALLGIQDLRWMATDSQIKKAYQKQALLHHPDKACALIEDTIEKSRLEEKFKAILVRGSRTRAINCIHLVPSPPRSLFVVRLEVSPKGGCRLCLRSPSGGCRHGSGINDESFRLFCCVGCMHAPLTPPETWGNTSRGRFPSRPSRFSSCTSRFSPRMCICRMPLKRCPTQPSAESMTLLTRLTTPFPRAASLRTSSSSSAPPSAGRAGGLSASLFPTLARQRMTSKRRRSSTTFGTASSRGESSLTRTKRTQRFGARLLFAAPLLGARSAREHVQRGCVRLEAGWCPSALLSGHMRLWMQQHPRTETPACHAHSYSHLAAWIMAPGAIDRRLSISRHALQCAECREHRRWIERENQRLRAKAKKEETKRIRDFVDRSFAADPRVIAHKAAVKAERERKRLEKAKVAKAKIEEEERVKKEAVEAREAQELAARQAADVARKAKYATSSCIATRATLFTRRPIMISAWCAHVQHVRAVQLRTWPQSTQCARPSLTLAGSKINGNFDDSESGYETSAANRQMVRSYWS